MEATAKPKEILGTVSLARITDYFTVEPADLLPATSPVDWANPAYDNVKVAWRGDIAEMDRRRIEAQMLPKTSYFERVDVSYRPEEVTDTVHSHIWDTVNAHLGTHAKSLADLVEQTRHHACLVIVLVWLDNILWIRPNPVQSECALVVMSLPPI